MKKVLFKRTLFIIVYSAALFSAGCKDENFDPKGTLSDKYVLNCILRSDTTVQTATLSRSYNVTGIDPLENTTDPALGSADIRVWVGDSVYVFREKEVPRSDTSRYKTALRYYYAENFRPQASKPAEILAVLPNGRKLHAATSIPQQVFTDFIASDSTVPAPGRNDIHAAWTSFSAPNTYYYPRFLLVYYKIENGLPVRYTRTVPARYVSSGGRDVPVFPTPTTDVGYSIEVDALSRTMQEISAGDPEKSNYVVLTLMVEIMTLDMNLSGFYSSGRLLDDGFSVKLDETDYTNIEGGLGIFGSFVSHEFPIRLYKNYIKSFGYKTKLGVE